MKFLGKLTSCNKSYIVMTALLQILLLGLLDYSTGIEMSFSVFYLIPVVTVAWFADSRTAVGVALISALTWQFAKLAAGEHEPNQLLTIWNTSSRFTFYLATTFLITRWKEALSRETVLARTDFLTGASNSRTFFDAAQVEINRCRRYQRYLSIVYADADNLKQINDTLGHNAGSDALTRFVAIANKNLRASDLVARLGGDEFVILLPETNSEQAQQVINKLRDRLAGDLESNGPALTFSMGVVSCAVPPETVDEMVKMADELMYEVKKSGKDSVRYREIGHGDYFEQQDTMAVLSRKIIFD